MIQPSRQSRRSRDDTLISVVLPLYNEAPALDTLNDRIDHAVANCSCRCEVIFVNDGSTDESSRLLDELARRDGRVRVIHFSRNFGRQAAVQAGLLHASGDAIVVMDSNLHDDPAAIAAFVEKWREGFDVVYAVRVHRRKGACQRWLCDAFDRVLNTIAQIPISKDAGNFGLIDRNVALQIGQLAERDRFFAGLRRWVGFRQIGVPVQHHAQQDGRPRATLRGLRHLAQTAIFSFSAFPLTMFYAIAAVSLLVCMGLVTFTLYHKLFTGLAIPGWASMTVTASFFGALNALGVGILGEYVIRIYDQVRARPLFIVERKDKLTNMTSIETTDPHQFRLNLRPTTTSAWVVLAVLVVSSVPLLVCMPLTDDVALYDLQARTLLDGGVLYRDIFEPNLPGVVWVHAGIRSLLGDSTEAMRIADLFLIAGIVFFLARCVRAMGLSTAVQAWTAVVLVMFYLSISEWNHCQRDVWLLVPALTALQLRRLQTQRLAAAESTGLQITGWALAEGLCWGAGVWLKPMIVVPAAACWLASAIVTRRVRPLCADLFGLLLGGLLIGVAGVAWMVGSGAWPFFLETFVEWNPRYFAAGKEHWTAGRFVGMCFRFFPWILLHLVAVPVAVSHLVRGLRPARCDHEAGNAASRNASLLFAVFYLAWLAQSLLLQHLFDYVHAPAMLLAIAMLAAATPRMRETPVWRPAVVGFLVIAMLVSPLIRQERLVCWPTCVTQGSTPDVQTKLALLSYPNWNDVDRVAAYLKQLDLKDGELTCFNNDLVHLYLKLGLRPPSRYVYLESLMAYFPEQRRLFRQSVIESPQRYIVTDLTSTRLPSRIINAQGPDGELSLPPGFPERAQKMFPWSYPIVFRAGTLLVHRVEPAASESPATPQQVAAVQASAQHPSATPHAEKN